MSKVHGFQEKLSQSEAVSKSDWLKLSYKDFFPTLKAYPSITEDGWAQRAGIDRTLHLADGTIVRAEEKYRFKNYYDFLFEYISSESRGTPGWIEKDGNTDYIVYVIVPRQDCHFLPYQTLKRTWRLNKDQWFEKAEDKANNGYRIVDGKNPNYVSKSLVVPMNDLYRAMAQASVVLGARDNEISRSEFLSKTPNSRSRQ